jgi:Isochorismatase family
MGDNTLVNSSFSSTIQAPIEQVDLPGWCFSMSEAEYQSCSPAHVSAGVTTTPDGRRMSINVEVTVRYAAELGYEVTMVKDATASYSHEHMRAALEINIPNYASSMLTADEIVAALSANREQRPGAGI